MRPARLLLEPGHWQSMRDQVATEAPLEACGLLAGKGERVEQVLRMQNAAKSAVRFRLDPQEQFDVFNAMDERGLELTGIYHSHPRGPSTPSPTDVAESVYPVVNLIWSPGQDGWQVGGFWIEDGQVVQVPIEIVK
jgi:[CysO sulfur-carrier protein]-S-L-cysteine hydrolase